MTPDELDEVLGAYALDAVTDDERAEIEGVLTGDPVRRAEADSLLGVAAQLGAAVPATPPPSLRSAVFEEIARTPQEAPVASLDAARHRRASRTGRGRLALLAGVAAAAVVTAVGGLAFALVQADQRADRAEQVAQVLADDDAVVVDLTGDLATTLRVAWSAEEDATVLLADGLAPVGEDQTYELWVLGGDAPVPAALFRPDDGGELRVRVEGLVPERDQLAVTVEPAGGSPAPTGDILATTS